jgi:pyridoxal phosphate enzyme (YggS family)
MDILKNYNKILANINDISKNTIVIVVSKTFSIIHFKPILDVGHIHFGENRVQESIDKWSDLLKVNNNLKLHLIGKLQTNKVAEAINHFSFIHSLDNDKIALKLSAEEKKLKKTLDYFVQVNLGEENQKSGILKQDLSRFINYCKNDLNLNIIGLMCLPPINEDSDKYFKELRRLAFDNNLKELSMGMSNDYIPAIKNGSTFVRVGSGIFEEKFN